MIRDQKSVVSNSKEVALGQFSWMLERHCLITELENLIMVVAIFTKRVCHSKEAPKQQHEKLTL